MKFQILNRWSGNVQFECELEASYVLSAAPAEVPGLIANVRRVNYESLGALRPNASRPAERFFLNIRKGDKPETNQSSKIALEWTDQWLAAMRAAFGPAEA